MDTIDFLIMTSKVFKLASCFNTQIEGNSIAIPDLIWFFNFYCVLTEILASEGDSVFFLGRI